MKLSWNWLNDYVDLSDLGPEAVAARLTLAVCEVDGIAPIFSHLAGLRVAMVESVDPHPGADRLKLCAVRAGRERLQIVCGAPNVRAGMLVPLAPVGATVPGKDGAGLEIRAAKIRGVDSAGMLCSALELGLEKIAGDVDGLLDLADFCAAHRLSPPVDGQALSEIFPLSDVVLDIDNKSITHRPDLWSHFGFAREIAALFKKPLRFDPLAAPGPKAKARKQTRPNTAKKLPAPVKKIVIEAGAAKAYFGVHVAGVRVQPAPLWMQARLLAVGQKPINNIVDVSNYLMFEVGQPNHAFDAAQLKSETVSVVSAGKVRGLKRFTTLDEVDREIAPDTVIILDGVAPGGTPVAIGGIIGGLRSGIADDTTELFLESATFPRERIRRSIAALGLRTDSAQRFEKGQDPAKAAPALDRMIDLLRKSCPDLIAGDVVGAMPEKPKRNRIRARLGMLQRRLGFAIEARAASDVLKRLHFEVSLSAGKDPELNIVAPTFRSQYDITIAEDIVEELGRVHGYDNIAPVAPLSPVQAIPANRDRQLARRLRQVLTAAGGYSEVYNYSFASGEENRRAGRPGLALKNPVFGDRPELRVSLIPGLVRQATHNEDRYHEFRIFEFGRVFLKDPGQFEKPMLASEQRRITLLHVPEKVDGSDAHPDSQRLFHDWLQMRDLLAALFAEAGVVVRYLATDAVWALHPGCAMQIQTEDGADLGFGGILHPQIQQELGLRRAALVADLDFDLMLKACEQSRRRNDYQPPSIFPDSTFELSLLLDESTGTEAPLETLRRLDLPEIYAMRLLTVYRGEPLPAGKKSASYEVRLLKADGTLSGKELQALMERCVHSLEESGFPLR